MSGFRIHGKELTLAKPVDLQRFPDWLFLLWEDVIWPQARLSCLQLWSSKQAPELRTKSFVTSRPILVCAP